MTRYARRLASLACLAAATALLVPAVALLLAHAHLEPDGSEE